MHIITGCGGSGTSFVAELLYEMGFDLGDVFLPTGAPGFTDGKSGGEDAYFHRLCALLQRNPGEVSRPHMRLLAARRTIVKCVGFAPVAHLWLEAGVQIEHVTICIRDMEAAARSFTARGFGEPTAEEYRGMIGRLVEVLTLHDVPMAFVPFPQVLHDWRPLLQIPLVQLDQDRLAEARARVARPHQLTSDGATR